MKFLALSLIYSTLLIDNIPIWKKYSYKKVNPFIPDNSAKRVMVIAHRGFSGTYPENTLLAFEKAIEAGADMIEFDINMSKDGHLVVIHDGKLDRTTSGKGKVKDYTLDELKQLDAGSWFGKEFAGEKIPTLEEVLLLAKNRVLLNIELKHDALKLRKTRNSIEEKAVKLVEKHGMEEQVVFSSFSPLAVNRIRRMNPDIQTAYLYHEKLNKVLLRLLVSKQASVFNSCNEHLTEKWLAEVKKSNMQVNVYTVDDIEEMKKFIAMGVDGIFTNYPDLLIKAMEN